MSNLLEPNNRVYWATRMGVILAVTGSAVGLGNFLRFPGQAAQYGGGAFMIPYVVAFLLLGLPIAWVEWSIGRYGGRHGFNSLTGVLFAATHNRRLAYFGALGLLIPVMIYTYYIYVTAWCLAYAWYYLVGQMPAAGDPAAFERFFMGFVGAEENGWAFNNPTQSPLIFLFIAFVLNFFLIYRGLTRGIEWFCKWAMPTLVLAAMVILVRVLTLGAPDPAQPELNVANGLGYMWNPSLEALWNPEIWLAAAGQVFFSLSVGFGIIVTYASYLRENDDIALSSVSAAAGNSFCEVALAGMMIIPAGFVFLGLSFVENPPGTFGMGFIALPNVFAEMPAGRVFGFLFFGLLFLAAVTSSLSMLQPAIAFLEEGFGLNRPSSVTVLGFITVLGTGFIVYFSHGFTALDTVDFWVASFGIYVLATVLVIVYGWVFGVDRGFDELQRGAEIRIPSWVRFMIKYVSPLFLLVVFGAWLIQNAPGRVRQIFDFTEPVVGMSAGLVALVLVLFLLLVMQAVKRWSRPEQGAQGFPVEVKQ